MTYDLCTDLLGAELVCGLHEVGTQHGEGHAVAMLSGELHALLELVLKDGRVETAPQITQRQSKRGRVNAVFCTFL